MFYNQQVLMPKQLLVFVATVFIAACSNANNESVSGLTESRKQNLAELDVYKRPSCGCCSKWVARMEGNGFKIKTHNRSNLSALKTQKGIKPRYQSCHTANSKDGYVFEGHIPAKFIKQFLQEKPGGAIGLAAPGMPVGSPGMKVGNKFMPYKVLLLKADGSSQTYAQVNTQREQY